MKLIQGVAGTLGLLALVSCSSLGVGASDGPESVAASPWICTEEEDAFGDVSLGCVSPGEIVTGQRLSLVMVCSTREGDDGVFDLNVIRATIRGDVDFGASPSQVLDEFADVALDDGEPEKVGIYRRDDHFTINHDPWITGEGSSQWDTLMNVAERHRDLTIRVQDADGASHSGVIQLDYLQEPLELMEGAGCVRNVSLY